jgi:pre-60S factor REI1
MKRRIASLPPVTLETFNEKVLVAKATSNEAAAKASYEKTCHTCSKAFYSENSYQNHLNSSKHKQRAARLRKDGDAASVQSSAFSLGEPVTKSDNDVLKVADDLKSATIEEQDEDMEGEAKEEEFPASRCLFCKTESTDIHANVDHMRKEHGMFIPEQKYLADLDGLLNYLYRKITENFECLYCHTLKSNAQAIQTHMRDKSHCMIAFDTEDEQVEIGQYYDFRSTYSDDEDESTGGSGGVKVNTDGDDQGWETESSASSVDEDDLEDTFQKVPGAYETDFELYLPSGRSVGHRSLAKYYKQNLHKYPTALERAARQLAIENGEIEEEGPRGRNNHHRALVTRANGGMGMIGVTEEQKKAALTAERRERINALRHENRVIARVQKANNHQKHFRVCFITIRFLYSKTNLSNRIPSCNDRSNPTSTRNHINPWVLNYGILPAVASTKYLPVFSTPRKSITAVQLTCSLLACFECALPLALRICVGTSATKRLCEVLFPSRAIFSIEFFNPVGFNEASLNLRRSCYGHVYDSDHLLHIPFVQMSSLRRLLFPSSGGVWEETFMYLVWGEFRFASMSLSVDVDVQYLIARGCFE